MSDKLTTKQAAGALGYHPGHIHRLVAQGIIKAEKIGNYWFFDRDYIERLRQEQDDSGRLHYDGKPIVI